MSASIYFSVDVSFFIAAQDLPAAVAALRTTAHTVEQAWGDPGWRERVLDATEGQEPREALVRLFDVCGWKLYFDQNSNVIDIYLPRDGVPDYIVGGHTDPLFYTLAPFVRDGSHMQMISSGGTDIVYHFRNGKCDYDAKVDPLDPRHAVVSRALLERISAYLIASDVAGQGTGAALAAELGRALTRE